MIAKEDVSNISFFIQNVTVRRECEFPTHRIFYLEVV